MKKRKYFGIGVMVAIMTVSLVGCKDKEEAPENVTKEVSEEEVPDIPAQKTEKLQFSYASGVYEEEFYLSIWQAGKEDIYYTTDGSDPLISDTAIKYDGPFKITDRKGDKNVVSAVDPVLISGNFNTVNNKRDGFNCKINAPSDDAVDKCSVVRAVIKNADGTVKEEISGTYFIGKTTDHINGLEDACAAYGGSLAVVSISANYDDFFSSETGIYVKGDVFDNALKDFLNSGERLREGETARSLDANYKQKGREWEREVNVTMFEFTADSATEVINQNCGIRIQGNYSRSDLQKGFRLYARNDYSDNNFKYAVFGEDYVNDAGEVMDKYKNLVLRAGGNCAFTSKFNDTFWQDMAQEANVDTKKSRPCVVYLNGEYWGLYVLEEDFSDDYFEDVHGVEKDNVVVYKGDAESLEIGYKLDEGELPEGESEDYYFRELKEFFATHTNVANKEDYDELAKLVDPESVMDYFAVECWINNKWDWPGKNWSMWKVINTEASDNKYNDGRWRFMLYDVEFGGVSGSSDAGTNTIKEDNYKPNGLLDMDTDNPAVLCFAYLMTNNEFRDAFYERIKGLSTGMFEYELLKDGLNHYEDMYAPLYDQFFRRYPGTGSTDEAINGGYASINCIRDFISRRAGNIQKMIDYCEKILE